MKFYLPVLFILISVFSARAATFVVTRTDDRNGVCNSGVDCSLREAVNAANISGRDDTIVFVPDLPSVTLTNEIDFADNGTLTINGRGADVFTIDGGAGQNRIFGTNGTVVTITDVTLTGGGGVGTDASLSGRGGAILANGGNLTLDRVHVTANESSNGFGGGGVYFYGIGTYIIQNSTFSANSSSTRCGGFDNDGGTLTVINSTVSGNTAGFTGGGFCSEGDTTLRNVTVTENTAITGGGIFLNVGTVNIFNTIVAGNSAGNGPEIWISVGGTVVSNGNNLIGDSAGDSANTGKQIVYQTTDLRDISPQLGALAMNGGATPTHSLPEGSPAVNAGNNSDATATDQRGRSRIIGGIIDIGAFEFAPPKSRKRRRFS